jgi:hypothetical protein
MRAQKYSDYQETHLCVNLISTVGTKKKLPMRGRSKSIYQLNEIRSDFTNNYY